MSLKLGKVPNKRYTNVSSNMEKEYNNCKNFKKSKTST